MSRRPTTPDRPPPPGDVRLSVVVPAYEEHDRIGSSVNAIREAFSALDGGVRDRGRRRRVRTTAPPMRRAARVPTSCSSTTATEERVRPSGPVWAPRPDGRSRSWTPICRTRRRSYGSCSKGWSPDGTSSSGAAPTSTRGQSYARRSCAPSADVSSTGSPGRCCGSVPRHAVRDQGVSLRCREGHLRTLEGRRVRVRCRAVRDRRAQ